MRTRLHAASQQLGALELEGILVRTRLSLHTSVFLVMQVFELRRKR